MKLPRRIFFITLLLVCAGCRSTTGTLSRAPVSYIRLSGIANDLTVSVDEFPSIILMPKNMQTTLQVMPGKHRIRVLSGHVMLVDRTIYVSDLQTLEISVPQP